MKRLILICFLFIFTLFVSGICEEGQIDINSASAIELDDIKWVGLSVAEEIISKRPFNSLDELVSVDYITESRIEDIINQNLACVNGYEEEPEEQQLPEEPEEEVVEINEEVIKDYVDTRSKEIPLTAEVISLTPKDIKSEDNTESLDKADYAKYGFIGFCILIGVLLVLKNKRKQKYEII